ncbi:unnamed protein product, partial [Linum tenue]
MARLADLAVDDDRNKKERLIKSAAAAEWTAVDHTAVYSDIVYTRGKSTQQEEVVGTARFTTSKITMLEMMIRQPGEGERW